MTATDEYTTDDAEAESSEVGARRSLDDADAEDALRQLLHQGRVELTGAWCRFPFTPSMPKDKSCAPPDAVARLRLALRQACRRRPVLCRAIIAIERTTNHQR